MKHKLALFFDGANHYNTLTALDISLDYKELLNFFNKEYDLVAAKYYSGIGPDKIYKNVRALLGNLSSYGYVIETKAMKKLPDGSYKANMDVEMAVDMVELASHVDRMILFSGDGDFTYAVKAAQRQGVFVSVCSSKNSAASELLYQANEFLDLQGLPKYEPVKSL